MHVKMNSFLNDLKEILLLTNSLSSPDKPITSPNTLISRLKNFNESCKNHDVSEELLPFKIKLLCNLLHILRKIEKQDHKCPIINSMTNIVKTSVIDDIEFFIILYNTVFYQIYKGTAELSEEIKLEVLEFSIELIKRSTKRVFELLYNENYSLKFSMGILLAVQIAKDEKSFKLRTTALDFLLYSMQYHRKNDNIIQCAVGDFFMFYLPGVITRIQSIILRDETQPHLITVKAITCWGQLLTTVMKDLNDNENLSDEEKIKSWMNYKPKSQVDIDTKAALQDKTRTKAWLQAAAQILQPLILQMPEVRKHSHPKVRLELTVQISRLLENCIVTLKNSLNAMIDILISSNEDEDGEVRDAAEFAITRFETFCRTRDGHMYLNVIEENLYSLIRKLPNIIHLQDDKAILNGFQTLLGDLKILNNGLRLGNVVSYSENLSRLIKMLVIALKLELYPEISAQDYSTDADMDSPVWTKKWKRFKHFSDDKIIDKINDICALLGKSVEIETILDYLINFFYEDQLNRNEVLCLINAVVEHCPDIQDNIVEQFLDLYLNPDYLYLPITVDGDECFTIQECHRNIITLALLTEGIGKLSTGMGIKFQNHMLKSLYSVIEKMGSSYRIIKTEGIAAAVRIATAVGLDGDIRQLIQSNVDYLTYHVTVKLRRGHPGVFDIVTVVMKNSPFEAMTNLEEIVQNVLKTSSEKFASPHTISYLRLFQTFVLCVNKWMTETGQYKNPIDSSITNEPEEKSDFDSLLEYIREKEKPVEDSNFEDVEETDQPQESDEEITAEKPKELPKHIQLTISIAENALNHLPSSDFDKKLIVLEILNECIMILADRENELLPLVHKIWSPLVTRFQLMTDPLLINRSFRLLFSLSRTSKDFIRRRTLKNVLPALRQFLLKTADESKLKDSGTGYQYTQQFKLQKELLDKLVIMAVDLRLMGRELDLVIESYLPYLNSFQPIPLQENCRKSLMDLKKHDPYLLWYKLQHLKDDPEFTKNANAVIDFILET